MANFIPLKNYMFYCLDRFIERYNLTGPFLDVGCGVGDLSLYMARRGWAGKATDISDVAISQARISLRPFPQIDVSSESLFDEAGEFKTIFLWDVIEHIENDEAALSKAASLLTPDGYLLIAVPSNPKEWRWDDDFYGHFRRYTKGSITKKLFDAGLEPVAFWDFTYPVFWIMRRAYTRFKGPQVNSETTKNAKTILSSTVNSWDISVLSRFLNRGNFLWRLLYPALFLFRNKLEQGHEMFVLAKKI